MGKGVTISTRVVNPSMDGVRPSYFPVKSIQAGTNEVRVYTPMERSYFSPQIVLGVSGGLIFITANGMEGHGGRLKILELVSILYETSFFFVGVGMNIRPILHLTGQVRWVVLTCFKLTLKNRSPKTWRMIWF